MTEFSFPRKFDLIIAPYFALNHLPSEDAVLSTLTLVAAHLVPGGYFSLHVADTDRLSQPLEQEAATRATIQYDTAGSKLQLDIVERHLDPATKCCSLVLRYSMIGADGAVSRMSNEAPYLPSDRRRRAGQFLGARRPLPCRPQSASG